MKPLAIGIIILLTTGLCFGQNTFKAKIIDGDTQEPLIGATLKVSESQGAISDLNGEISIPDFPNERTQIEISFVGYEPLKLWVVGANNSEILVIELHPGEELEEVVVTSTRSSRTIEDIPTRIEAIGTEELEEKAIMRSSNIAMLLRESTGIQMQQTSASSANQSIRIQGLDGRYTQILKDGFPLFGGFSGGLSIMQIPPLDLKQVEVIKGSNSTLYGGGAIAGLVNLVTIRPEEERKLKIMIDQTQAQGTTLNTFYAKRNNKFGLTLFASASRQQAYDSNDDDFSDIPQIRGLTFNPSFFYYFNDHSSLRFTINGTTENRLGGDMQVIENDQNGIHQFTEENESDRISYQLKYTNEFDELHSLNIKSSLTTFNRKIKEPNFTFEGKQWSSFNEVSYTFGNKKSDWISGLNLYTDNFNERKLSNFERDYENVTVGGFLQNTTDLSESLILESGLRWDYAVDYGSFLLPRLSILKKVGSKVAMRLGGGLGYKLPTIFTEDAENLTFQNIAPIDNSATDAERSIGGNYDVNFKTLIGDEVTLSINQLFFYTQLDDALVFRQSDDGSFFFENADGSLTSQGIETNLKLGYKDFKVFANYAFTNTELNYDNINDQKPLTPKHSIGAVLVYEVHGKWRIGYEAYYTGSQYRADRTLTDHYWIMGFMAMRKFKNISVYANFENFTDTRQHKLESFDIGEHYKPQFPQIWAPTDGSIINAGVIIEL